MWWPLMQTAITKSDKKALVDFINSSDRYTCGNMVKQFEDEWSRWLGCKYSLYVTSGSTANLLLMAAVKEMYNIPNGSKVLVPACTWVTNVSPVFQVGLEPVFCDVNLENYSFDVDNLPDEDVKIVFVTHLLGLNSPIDKLKDKYPDAIFIEDICESHGVKRSDGMKCGSTGVGSTFSFYYGHHMTTVEGGMISTDNELLYELMKIKRSHGMARLLSPQFYEEAIQKHPNIDPSFLFLTDGYNFRNTEINAVLGIEQLKRLDENIEKRRKNFERFMKHLDPEIFYIPYDDPGNSSFAFPFICRRREDMLKLKTIFNELEVEYRPIVSGNLLLHPFLKKWKDSVDVPNANILNDNGVYIGNNHFITEDMVDRIFEAIKSNFSPR
jgi:CDP-4-dehydro-6-deoxyglucose reductase, E1